jgi:hypothetical protein
MNLYNLLNDTLFQITQDQSNNKYNLFIFGIGTYPHRPESNHEDTQFYIKHKDDPRFEVYRILIDPTYEKLSLEEISSKYDNRTIILSESVESREYYMILDFCNFASKFNCLSVIMEFTSIQRNNTFVDLDSVYISTSDCLANTDNINYNPIIINDTRQDKLVFYRIILDNLYIELQKLTSINTIEYNIEKIEYIRYLIILNFLKINIVYRKTLCYMKVEEDFENSFCKNHENFDRSIQQLLYRIAGYYGNDIEQLIKLFKNSSNNDLNEFIKNIINNILIDCLYLEKNGLINESEVENIKFNNDSELKILIDYYEKLFHDEIERNNMRLY